MVSVGSIDVIMVNSRGETNPDWVARARRSIRTQTQPINEIIEIDNLKKDKTLGRCWNIGIKQSDSDWIFFIDDDDWISDDYIHTHVAVLYRERQQDKDPVAASAYCTFFDSEGRYSRKDVFPKGLIKRSYLLKYPFDESRLNERIADWKWTEEAQKRNDYAILIPWQFGYFYRQHDKKMSKKVRISDG